MASHCIPHLPIPELCTLNCSQSGLSPKAPLPQPLALPHSAPIQNTTASSSSGVSSAVTLLGLPFSCSPDPPPQRDMAVGLGLQRASCSLQRVASLAVFCKNEHKSLNTRTGAHHRGPSDCPLCNHTGHVFPRWSSFLIPFAFSGVHDSPGPAKLFQGHSISASSNVKGSINVR